MKNIFLKTMVATCLVSCLNMGAWAQENGMVSKNLFAQRQDLIKKYGVASPISIGWYTGGVTNMDARTLWNNYLLLGNYLSEKLNKLVIVEADKNDREIAVDAIQNMDAVYTSALMGSQLVKAGWKPVVGRSDDLHGVILTQNNILINSAQDIKKIKVAAASGATVTQFTEYSLIKDGVYDLKDMQDNNSNFKVLNTKQTQMLEILKNKQADGIVVRESVANKMMKDNPGQFKISYKALVAPGHMLYVRPGVSEDVASRLKDALLSLNPDVPSNKAILDNLDGYTESDKSAFRAVGPDSVEQASMVFNGLNEKPLNSH